MQFQAYPCKDRGAAGSWAAQAKQLQFPHMEKESKDAKGGYVASQRVPADGIDFGLTGISDSLTEVSPSTPTR